MVVRVLVALMHVLHKATVLEQADELLCHSIDHAQGGAGEEVVPAVLASAACGHGLLPALKRHEQRNMVALGLRGERATHSIRRLQ